MLTFIVFVLSTTLIVVQLASGQLSPRVISLVLTRPLVKVVLVALTFTYTFTLAALARVEGDVPSLRVGIAVVLNLVCIVVFFQFVQRLASGLRPASLLQRYAQPEEIANLICYVCAKASSATNGAALRADGGIVTNPF